MDQNGVVIEDRSARAEMGPNDSDDNAIGRCNAVAPRHRVCFRNGRLQERIGVVGTHRGEQGAVAAGLAWTKKPPPAAELSP